jgi:FixJ family two-component response regulator
MNVKEGAHPCTVAVVDNEASLCRAMTRLLRAEGFHASAYTSAEDFLADRGWLAFDCLLLDVQMEGMSGLELQRQLTEFGATMPVIFISGHDEPEYRALAERAGCTAFFSKNDLGTTVIAAIREATAGRAAL